VDALYQLIYTSFLSADADPHCVTEIVSQARSKNRQQKITGVLIFDGLRFCQYLEGPSHAVRTLSERIRNDSRHIHFQIKEHGTLQGDRRFTYWPMAFAACGDPDGLNELHKFVTGSGESAFTLFERLLPSLDLEPGGAR